MTEQAGIELLHAMPGRIRIRLPDLKGNPPLAREVQQQLSGFPSVRRVEANPVTASVLVLYDPTAAPSVEDLAEMLFPGIAAHSASPAEDGSAASPADPAASAAIAERIADYFRRINGNVSTATGGPDLKVLLPGSLFLFGVKRLITSKETPLPTWYDLLWFSFGTFLMLNRVSARDREQGPAPTPTRPEVHPIPAAISWNGAP